MANLIKQITKSNYYRRIFRENRAKIDELRSVLADDRSAEILDLILKAYKATVRHPGYYFLKAAQECNIFHFVAEDGYVVKGTDNPYFSDEIFNIDNDIVFLDGGGFIGDSLEQLYKKLNGPFRYAYSFEPNPESYAKLLQTVSRHKMNVQCINAGLDNKDGTASFKLSDSGSWIASDGEETITVVDIKRFLKELTDVYPTFIKLDIEGKETDVINAMSDFIKARKPDLAISVYHKLEDLWEIPLLIHSVNKDYKIYLRHQSNYFTETVCYATCADNKQNY